MKHKYLTLVALVVVATAMTGAGLVSAGHDPTNPDDVYIHEIQGSIQQGQGAQICVRDMGADLNRITVEGETTHTDSFIHHDGADGDVVLDIPELTTPPGHKIVVYTNGENPFIDNLASDPETCTQGGDNVQGPLVLGVYYLVTGQIELTRGVDITTGPNEADDAPAPGSGNPSIGAGAGVPSDETTLGANEPTPDDTDAPDVGQTQPLYGSPENLADGDSDSPEGTVDDTTEDAETVVEQVQRAVADAIASLADDGSSTDDATNTTDTTNTSDASADAPGTDGGNVGAGAIGLTGFFGLLGVLFALIRDRSH